MSDVMNIDNNVQEVQKEFKIEIVISDQNLSYKSDFDALTTVGMLEAIKTIIIKETFPGLKQES